MNSTSRPQEGAPAALEYESPNRLSAARKIPGWTIATSEGSIRCNSTAYILVDFEHACARCFKGPRGGRTAWPHKSQTRHLAAVQGGRYTRA
jgi:hypothetical protein